MRSEKLISFLETAFRGQQTVMVIGEPGVGKSECIDQAVANCGYAGLEMHLVTSDPTVVQGLPYGYTENGDRRAEFVAYGDVRNLIETKTPLICHLEDFGQATPATQAATMQLLQRRSVNGHKIASCVGFVLSSNDTNHLAGVSGCLEPVKSRTTIVSLEPSLDDVCNHFLNRGGSVEVVAFLRFRPALLNDFKPSKGFKQSPNPRNWWEVSKWLQAGVKDLEVFTGRVGEGAATEFYSFLDLYASLPSLDAILLDPVGSPIPDKPAALFAVSTGLARKATSQNLDRVTTYLNRLPKEFEVMSLRDAVRQNKTVTQCAAFVAWATKNSSVLL